MYLASFENSEKCGMSNRPGGDVRVASNGAGNIGWTKCAIGSQDIMWSI